MSWKNKKMFIAVRKGGSSWINLASSKIKNICLDSTNLFLDFPHILKNFAFISFCENNQPFPSPLFLLLTTFDIPPSREDSKRN